MALRRWYKLDGNGNDSISSETLTITGATSNTTTQKLGTGCYDFDGSNDYLRATVSTSKFAETFTFDAWVSVTNTANLQTIFNKYGYYLAAIKEEETNENSI
jgi:hypothetical protein